LPRHALATRIGVAGLAAAACALAGPIVPAAAAEPTVSVVVALRAGDPAALDALAHATGLSIAARHARLAALVPGAKRHDDVTRRAAGLGLRVTHSDDWTMTLSGPRTAVRAAFGSITAPMRPLSLAAPVLAVLPTTGRVAHPLASIPPPPPATTGADLRTAYAAPAGTTMGQGLTIATVQLSGWKSADLTSYGKTLSPPVTPSYTAISINGANPDAPDGFRGDTEVALDQETLLAVAPAAAQRAYFAPGDDGGNGFITAVDRVADDVVKRHIKIAALSISWGACEAVAGSQFMAAMDQALEVATAAGVSVFAASGDDGGSDCLESTGSFSRAVDYPASSAYAVAVGGTTLHDPANPSAATAWWGSGGGQSTRTPLPAWQQSERAKAPLGKRLVPDIASDGDPANGIAVLDTVPEDSARWWNVVGGTSFGAPAQAALLTESLESAGWTSGGIGDLHPALYDAAAASSTAFTDITSGDNGTYSARSGFDLVTGLGTPRWSDLVPWLGSFTLSTPAAVRTTTFPLTVTLPSHTTYRAWSAAAADVEPSCATATASSPPTSANLGAGAADGPHVVYVAGIDGSAANSGGGACHVVRATVALDRSAPAATASVRPASASTAIAVWSSTDTAPSSGAAKYAVSITDHAGSVYSATTTATSVSFPASAYRSYNVSVVAIDPAGNRSATATALLVDDLDFGYGSGWTTATSSSYYRGSAHATTAYNAVATVAGTGKLYVVYVTTCPTCGTLKIYDHNTLLRTVSLTTNRTHPLVPVTLLSTTTAASRTFTLHTARTSATATSIQLDAAVIR
jgi:hypothetical protein